MDKLQRLKGDKVIWAITAIMMIASFLSVYSASANIVFVYGKVGMGSLLAKHASHLVIGLAILFFTHLIPLRYVAGLSIMAVIISIALLFLTLSMGTEIGGANASRWLVLPGLRVSIQTSAFASLALLIYLARALTKKNPKDWNIVNSWIIYVPLVSILALIFPANFSTAALLFFSCALLLIVGGFPFKYLAAISGALLTLGLIFVLIVSVMPSMSNRVDTWKARIESFKSGEKSENYQVDKAKMAISNGMVLGKGPGKSAQKNFLPQSNSDFIYAIIVEEYGLLGGLFVIGFYIILWVRIMRIALKSVSLFGSLVAFAAGFSLTFQAFVNMAVAVNLVPVTGQTLPLLSAGGSSIWVTCLALGMILRVSIEGKQEEKLEETSTASNISVV